MVDLTWEDGVLSGDEDAAAMVRDLAESYEGRSVILTTNLVFSEWGRIFKDPMTTLAAIDRVVHHSVILDLMAVESYRAQEAKEAHDHQIDQATGAEAVVVATGKTS